MSHTLSKELADDLIIERGIGARQLSGISAKILVGIALLWSLFQIWIASPFPFITNELWHIPILDAVKARYVHLAFAMVLAYLSYPALRFSPVQKIPLTDWTCAAFATISTLYLLVFDDALAVRTGLPTLPDIMVAAVGMLLLIEATRRTLGLPLVIIAVVFLVYTFFGSMDFIPDIIRHKGQSLNKVASHMWLTTEGVFGVALGVSTSFVFLFVLFGALLDKAGAGNYFIKLAFSLLGHMRGGPAKAAVLSSALTGIISGSSIANVVTTGTFTIPLMRRVGFTREEAGAVEVASSVNGQIMPPVMGAAAFLMAEYVGIPYTAVMKHAVLPALISYIALLYMVHLEAVKHHMKVLPKPITRTWKSSFFAFGITVTSLILLSALVYYSIGWVKAVFPDHALGIILAVLGLVYLILLRFEACRSDLEIDDPQTPLTTLPKTGKTFLTGLHYLLPIIILIWCLMVERFSPGLAAFYAVVSLVFIITTQRPAKAFFRKSGNLEASIKQGFVELFDGLVTGARNMIPIGIATAAAGIIVGVVSLTGVGQVLTEVVEILSGGSVILILLYTAVISLILGMGLPTTANYIVVASLMVKVIQDLGMQNGLIVPAIAIHMFVFYFGIMADVTPPVGLASFAAAAVSGGDPIRTGMKGFMYSLRTIILPFFFIFDPELLLIGVPNFLVGVWVCVKALVALLLFSSALQGYFIVRNKWYESVTLLLVTAMYFAPQFWINLVVSPYGPGNLAAFEQTVAAMNPSDVLKINVTSYDFDGIKHQEKVLYMPITEGKTSIERLQKYGLIIRETEGKFIVDDVAFNSAAERAIGFGDTFFDYEHIITGIEVRQPQPSKRWVNIPATLLLGSVVLWQLRRKRKMEG